MKIQSARLINETPLEFGDFNVFIGGNAVGKTTLVLELYSRATNSPRTRWYWIGGDTLSYSTDDLAGDLRTLLSSLTRQYDGANLFYYSQAAKNLLGNTDLDSKLRFTQSDYEQLKTSVQDRSFDKYGDIFNNLKFRRPFVSFESCEARLNLPNRANITGLNQPPQDALNVLYRNLQLLEDIDKKVHEQFDLHIALLDHIRIQVEMGLSKEAAPTFDNTVVDRQSEFARIETWKDKHFYPVEEIGHGIRSMIKLLMSLLDPVNQVLLIDEPEMHIYPAQKRWIGRQLILLSREQKKQVFLVTHDPILLQGILDSPATTRIFRINLGQDDSRSISRCDLEHVRDIGAKRNQDSYLQGLFYQRCIGVEGATDRAFYQIVTEELFEDRIADRDLGFVSCGGKGASKNMVFIASRVRLKSAFIYDFDALLLDVQLMEDIYQMRGGKGNQTKKLREFLNEKFKLDEKEIKTGTQSAMKLGLQSEFVKNHYSLFDSAIRELAEVGIFIVPNGSLESWAPDVEQKVRFAEIAPDLIKADPKLRAQVEEFIQPILTFVGC